MSDFIPTDEQWSKMQRFIKSDKYKKEDFFVFETLAVGDRIVPDRYIKITPELLQIMRDDAEKGVSLMINHNWNQLGVQSIPIGKVFDARIGGPSQEGETMSLYTTQYILRDDSKVDGYSKNDIIRLIETGTLADTSIGWGTTTESYECSICHNSIYDYRHCEHIPGQKYIVDQDTNEVETCIVLAKPPKELHAGNNVLMENSIVFDGAYPNAIIQSAGGGETNKYSNGLKVLNGKQSLEKDDLVFGFSTGDNINLLYKQLNKKGGLEDMTLNNEFEENTTDVTPETEEAVEETVATEEVENVETEETTENQETVETTENTDSVETVENEEEKSENETEETETMSVENILNKFDNIATNIDELVVLAKEGLEARNETIKNALESGVHSMGNAFNKEVFSKTFASMSTKDIKVMGEAWEQEATQKFKKEKVSKQGSMETKVDEGYAKVNYNSFKTGLY